MISVQSLRQLLSGSSILLLVLLVLAGCTSKKNKTKTTDSVGDIVVPGRVEPSDTVPYVLPDSLLNSSLYTYKDSYHIAVMLPLYLDSFETVITDTLSFDNIATSRETVYPPAKVGLEFYHGVRVAIDSLKADGLKVTLHLYDSFDDNVINRLVSSNALLKMDLIIGPIYNSHIKLLAPYIQKNNIPMVSPLSPSGDLTKNNPSFLMANPRLEVHSERMFQLVADSFAKDNLILLYQSNDVELEYAKSYRQMAQFYKEQLIASLLDSMVANPPTPVVFHEVAIEKNEKTHLPDIRKRDFETFMEAHKNNVFVVPSVDMSLVLNLSKELYQLSEDYQITVVGTPIWARDEQLRLDYVDSLNVHFTSSVHLDSVYYTSQFRQAMIDEFGFEPTLNTLKAYDITRYLGSMIINYGTNYMDMLKIDEQAGWHTNFRFRPGYTNPSTTSAQNLLYLENKFVHVLKYQDYKLIKLN